MRLKIHETTRESGELTPTFLEADASGLTLTTEDGRFPLPDGALEAVMKRYGAPLDPNQRLADIGALDLPAARLRHVRHLAFYDVIARDYLVYEARGAPVCALATTVAAALTYLSRR